MLPKELVTRYGESLAEHAGWTAGALVGSLVFALGATWLARRHLGGLGTSRWALGALTLLATGAGLYLAWTLRWVCDDAFISFRYADHLASGFGLVFNAGERVEGYTNFLWTVIIAGAIRVGLDPATASIVLSLASFAAVIGLAQWLAVRLSATTPRLFLPLTAIVLAVNYTMASFGTSGLETMFATLLVLVAVERAESNQPLAAGVAGILATLSHPDHAIFYVAIGGILAVERARRRQVLRYALPFLLLYLPYFAWRYSYYGELFPNTYYAKSGNLTYFSQGGKYLLISWAASGLVAALPLMLYGVYVARRTLLARFVIVAVPLYLVYVAKIGGDFMLGRLLCPVLPPAVIVAELGARSLVRDGRAIWASLALACLALGVVPTRVVTQTEKFHHVADERNFYPVKSLEPTKIGSMYAGWADALNEHFVDAGLSPTFGVGCVGIIGYETGLPIVDTFGLTDRRVAHQSIERRGRPGHEKRATSADLLAGGVHFSDQQIYPPPFEKYNSLKVKGIPWHLAKYDRRVMQRLKADRRVRFSHFEQVLDRYDPMRTATPEALACDVWFFEEYYFKHNDDRPRLRSLRARLVGADPSLAGLEDFLLAEPGPQDPNWERVRTRDFEDLEQKGWRVSGAAFDSGPLQRTDPGQQSIHGHHGHFIGSYHPEHRDAATGWIETVPFEIAGDVITFNIGGGQDVQHLAVELLVDGRPVFSATGCGTELLGRRVWNVSSLRGERAKIHIRDDSLGGWGHITVDDIVEWRRRPRS